MIFYNLTAVRWTSRYLRKGHTAGLNENRLKFNLANLEPRF